MTTPMSDEEDAHAAIERTVGALLTAGVSEEAIAASLLARSVFLWRKAGFTDAEIASEFLSCIEVPLGRK